MIAITAGDVAGIGPEIVARAVSDDRVLKACSPVFFGHPAILQRAFQLCDLPVPPMNIVVDPPGCKDRFPTDRICCVNFGGNRGLNAKPREVSADAGDGAFQALNGAIEMARPGIVDAIATAPLNKAALHAAGHTFPGHTEILAHAFDVASFAMMLHLPESRLAPVRDLLNNSEAESRHGVSITHVTLHTSIDSVPDLLTTEKIAGNVQLMDDFLQRIRCERRAIAVCALNPHGGEDGLFGDEESRIIQPAVDAANAAGFNVTGPLPVDTLIRRAFLGEFDGVVAMYHDQGHIPVKLIGFDAAVNITLGLPIIRTSPTHGTAFDRAWDPQTPADPSGMIEAILTAATLSASNNRKV